MKALTQRSRIEPLGSGERIPIEALWWMIGGENGRPSHQQLFQAPEAGVSRLWGIRARRGEFVGMAKLGIQPGHSRARLSMAVSMPQRGHGFVTDAIRALLHFGFSRWGSRRIEAHVRPSQVEGASMLRAAGFQQEARLRERFGKGGQGEDQHILALLCDDWLRTLPQSHGFVRT